jgi:hypothetical protein
LRKRKDSKVEEKIQVDDTLQNREEGVEIITIEEETTIRKIKDKKDQKKIRTKEIEDKNVEYEEDNEEIIETKNILKSKKSKINNEELPLEEIEDLEIVHDVIVPSLLINIPKQQNEAIATNRAVDQAPTKVINEKARINLDFTIALNQEYHEIQEKEINRANAYKPESRKASLSIIPIQPYSTTETIIQNETEQLSDVLKPLPGEAASTILPIEGIIVTEVLPTEAKLTTIEHKDSNIINKAEITLTLQEAKIISEMTTNEKEITENHTTPNTVQAKKSVIPQQSISIIEVQESLKESNLEEIKIIKNNPKVTLDEIESIQIEEVYTEDKPDKYYPELIVPTEAAISSIVEQKQRFTEELLVSEKEGEYIPNKLPTLQIADVEVSSGREAIIIHEQSVQESENVYYPDRKVDTYEAKPNINVFESINILSIDSQQQESELTIEDIKLSEKIAVVDLTEARTGATILEIIANDKEKLNIDEHYKPDGAIANLNVSAHLIAINSEILSQENTADISIDHAVTSKALLRQEAHEELIITETNIAEVEKPQEEDVHPNIQRADMEFVVSNNLIINELNTVLTKVCITTKVIN